MFALLDEQQSNAMKAKSKRSKDNDEQEGMQHESNLDFSSGMTILPGLSLKSGQKKMSIPFVDLHFSSSSRSLDCYGLLLSGQTRPNRCFLRTSESPSTWVAIQLSFFH